jgi:steroid delta-isomerase-like uncharacterized protein
MSQDLSPQELNKLIARRFLKIWNAGGEALVDDLAAPDIVFSHSRLQEPMRGASLLKQVLAQTHDSFPDMRIEADEVLAEGDKVMVRWTYRATHRNNVLFGVAPSGKRVEVSGVSVYRIVNRQVVEEIGLSDTMSLILQLGAALGGPK